jgi:RNA polymerase sigma-70 factor (ECF subfamily)
VTPGPTTSLRFDAVCSAPAPSGFGASAVTFDGVYDEHAEFVWRSIRRLGVDESAADDVLQQVFLVVHRRLPEFAGASSVRTWLFGILLRVVREHRRTLHRKSPHLRGGEATDDDLARVPDASTAANPEQALSRAEASRVITELLDQLEDDKRAVFVLAELEQMTAPEIAEALGMDPPAVYSRLRAARTDFEKAAAAYRRRGLGGKQ